MRHAYVFGFLAVAAYVSGCATTTKAPPSVEAPVSQTEQVAAQKQITSIPQAKVLKRKIAIGRFTNETRYGKTLLRQGDIDPLGKQTSDMLASRLVASQKFLVFERQNIEILKGEQQYSGEANLMGVDTLIIGSLTEFGRSTTGRKGVLSSTKLQRAHAKVEIRLVDPHTGYVFFSATGTGEATTESGGVAGFRSRADYDATLNDQAIGAAISDLMNDLVSKLEERSWRTDILDIQADRIFISGGKYQGLQVGDQLAVMRRGETIRSRQTGFDIELPGTKVATIRVLSHFGDSQENEGSVAQIVEGSVPRIDIEELYVAEE